MSSQVEQLPKTVSATLQDVRRHLRRYIVWYALLSIAAWLLLIFWLGGVVDFLPVIFGGDESPRWLRVGWLGLMILGSLWIVFFWAIPRLFARIKDRSLALLIERRYPELNFQLVTSIESHADSSVERSDLEIAQEAVSNPEAHHRMLQGIEEILGKSIQSVRTSELFDWKPLLAAALTVILSLAITGFAAMAMPGWMQLWSQRLFALSDQKWPRRAELRSDGVEIQLPTFTGQLAAERKMLPFVDERVRVPRGATTVLHVSANATDKQVPELCTLFYETNSGARGRANLRRIGRAEAGWQEFILDGPPLDGVSEDLVLDVVGLDARLSDLRLSVVEPPVITEMKVRLSYPSYLLSSLTRAPVETLVYRNGMRIPQGTQVELIGVGSTQLRQAQFVKLQTDLDAQDSGPQIRTVPGNESEFEIDLGVLSNSCVVEIRLVDNFGLSSDQIPRYLLGVKEDTVPEVSTRLVGIGNAVTSEARIVLEGTVQDDQGIAEIFAELTGANERSVRLPLEIPSDLSLSAEIDLRALKEQGQFEADAGDTLSLVVSARDYFDLEGQSHLGSGQPKQLQVVTTDELLVILDREELELRQRLEIIISELEQLRDSLNSMVAANLLSAQKGRALRAGVVLQEGPDSDPDRQRRMQILKAQQGVLQGDKSRQELLGVAVNVEGIRLQLVNNRIDSYDRQQRLSERVHQPLNALLEEQYPQLSRDLLELQSAAMSGESAEQARSAVRSLDVVLLKLTEIKENMKYLESFNEIIDLVRTLLEDQERVLEATEKAQRERILELLK